MKVKKILLRILCLPMVALIMLVNSLLYWMLAMYQFVRYGGETTIYKSSDKATIVGIYELLDTVLTTGDYDKLIESLEKSQEIMKRIKDLQNEKQPNQ